MATVVRSDINKIRNSYFEWLCDFIYCQVNEDEGLEYNQLLSYLYDTEFVSLMRMDDNRAIDGEELRKQFGQESKYSKEKIEESICKLPCNMLEMLVALANRIEVHIMAEPGAEDRTYYWFWLMIWNLGLRGFWDGRFDLAEADIIMDRFMNRNYKPNGEGGLIVLDNPRKDLRRVDIWYQWMWYIAELYQEGK